MLPIAANSYKNFDSTQALNSGPILVSSTRPMLTTKQKLSYIAIGTISGTLGATLVATGLFATPCYLSCFLNSAKRIGLPIAICSSAASALASAYFLRQMGDRPTFEIRKENGREIIEIRTSPKGHKGEASLSNQMKEIQSRPPKEASNRCQIYTSGTFQNGSNLQFYFSK